MRGNPRVHHLTGQTFGRWRVLGLGPRKPPRRSTWECQCECGAVRNVEQRHLVSGKSTSCGCGKPKGEDHSWFKHGRDNRYPGMYMTWRNMIERCTNPKNKSFHRYGGRGIAICDSWLKDFKAFAEDMGQRPSQQHSIDRIDNDKGYSPDNCRWATPKEQGRNTRRARLVTVKGETMSLVEAVEKYGGVYGTVKWRLRKGQTIEEALKL